MDIEPAYDPLSRAVQEEEDKKDVYTPSDDEGFIPWTVRKPGILKKYTTNERVSISVSFMENENGESPCTLLRLSLTLPLSGTRG